MSAKVKLIRITTGRTLNNLNFMNVADEDKSLHQCLTLDINGRVHFTTGDEGREIFTSIKKTPAKDIITLVEKAMHELYSAKLGETGSLWHILIVYEDNSVMEAEALGVGDIVYHECSLSAFIRERIKIDDMWLFHGKGVSPAPGRIDVMKPGMPGDSRQCLYYMDRDYSGHWKVMQ